MGTMASSFERPREEWVKGQKDRTIRFNKAKQDPDPDGFFCEECGNKGYIAYCDDEGHYTLGYCKKCRSRRSTKRSLALSGMEELFERYSFLNFDNWSPWAQSMKQVALDWAKGGRGWLMLCGQPGSGKTHLAVAACGYRLGRKDQQVEALSWREFVGGQMNRENTGRQEEMERKMGAELLYVDDLFKTARGRKEILPWEVEIFFELINHRYAKRLDTVITTEWTPGELLSIDEAIGSRLIEMAGKHLFTVGKDAGKNYRLKTDRLSS